MLDVFRFRRLRVWPFLSGSPLICICKCLDLDSYGENGERDSRNSAPSLLLNESRHDPWWWRWWWWGGSVGPVALWMNGLFLLINVSSRGGGDLDKVGRVAVRDTGGPFEATPPSPVGPSLGYRCRPGRARLTAVQ